MPVTVTIPVTEDYREVTLALGEADYLTSICLSPDYIFGVTDEAPAKLVRISRSDFSQRSVLTFANDDEHKNGADVMHVGATVGGGIYVMFRNGLPNVLMISKVDFTTTPMTYTDWWREEDYAAGYGTMTTDDVYVYALIGPFPNAYIARMKLSDQTAVITQIPGVTFGRNLRISGSPAKLYAVGQTDPPDDGLMWVKRLRFDTDTLVVEQSTTISGGNTTVIPNNIGIELQPKDYIWVGSRDFTGTLKRIQKSNLSNVTTVATAITPSTSSGCRAMEDDNPYVWALFDNGKAVRINTDLPSLEQRTYALSGGFHYRMVSGDPYLFGSFYSAPTKIARYHIPSDIVPGSLAWAKMQGCEGGHVFMRGAVVDVEGNIYMAGYFTGDLTIGSFEISSNFFGSIFVAKFDSSGNALIVKKFSATGNQVNAVYLTIDSAGNLVLVGNFQGTLNFEGTSSPISNTGTSHVYVAKLSGQTLLGIWAKEFSGATYGPVVTDDDDNVYLAPSLGVTAIFDSFTLTKPSGVDPDFGLVKLNGNTGLTAQAQRIGGPGSDVANSIAIGPDGNIVIAGSYQGEINLGDGARPFSGGIFDLFVAKYTPTGDWLNDRTFGSSGTDTATSVTIHPVSGNIIIAGSLGGAVNFGSGSVGADGGGYIAGFSPDLNTNYWVKETGDGSTGVTSVKVDGDGRLTLMGQARAAINWGIFPTNQAIGSNGQENAFITAFSLTGNNAPVYRNWTIYLGRQGTGQTNGTSQASPGIAISGGEIIAAGRFQFTEDFGGVEHTASGVSYYSGFLAKYAF